MNRLEYIFDLYKNLKEEKPEEAMEIDIKEHVKYEPQEGEVIEIFPSFDGLEIMLFIFKIQKNHMVELIPLSRFWELAGPQDALVKVGGEIYIAQTDLSFDLPSYRFSERFGNRLLLKVGELDKEDVKEVEMVYEGKKRGVGGIYGGIKGEFKKLEAERYFSIFSGSIIFDEFLGTVEGVFGKYKSELPMAASNQERFYGKISGFEWFYHEEEEKLIFIPSADLIGKNCEIYFDIEGEKLILFKGKLTGRIEISVSKENFSSSILNKKLKIEYAG